MRVLLIFIALLGHFVQSSCSRAADPTPPVDTPPPATENDNRKPLELTAIELHKVKLDYPHKIRENDGKEREYNEAWLVLFALSNLGPVTDMRLDFFIGEYRIPEYGGLKDGIYFRIYDERVLQSLDGQEISVGLGEEQKQSLGKKFSIQGYKKLSIEAESAVLKR